MQITCISTRHGLLCIIFVYFYYQDFVIIFYDKLRLDVKTSESRYYHWKLTMSVTCQRYVSIVRAIQICYFYGLSRTGYGCTDIDYFLMRIL